MSQQTRVYRAGLQRAREEFGRDSQMGRSQDRILADRKPSIADQTASKRNVASERIRKTRRMEGLIRAGAVIIAIALRAEKNKYHRCNHHRCAYNSNPRDHQPRF